MPPVRAGIISSPALPCPASTSHRRPFSPSPPLWQNVWRNPNLKGQWAKGGGGTLAAEERALLDAYGPSNKAGK